MCQDKFIKFTLMYVSKNSQMYKLKKNYKIINIFNNIISNKKIKGNGKKEESYNFFDTTSFEDETDNYSTDRSPIIIYRMFSMKI